MMKAKREKGLTLIEMVMTIVIVGILAGGGMFYIRQVIDLWSFVTFRNEVVYQGRTALARMSRDIRQISNNTSVFYANSTRFRFAGINNASVDYYLSNTDLMRNNDALASGVRNLTLTYYNLTNQPIANPLVNPQATNIRRISIRLNIFSGDQNKTLTTQVWPRNFGG
jgi:prepilin-type N-terminal cleavage/methylation domain-containing protein